MELNDQETTCVESPIEEKKPTRESVIGFNQPSQDFPGGALISGPGVGPSGMQPRPLELRKVLPKITRATEDSVSKAKRFAMEQSASFVLYRQVERQTDICPIAQVSNTQRQRIVNLMCRIYVGGIGFDIREDTVKIAFSPFGPIRRIDMSWDSATQNKGFAFVEYEVPDSAELALDQMNNTMINSRPIKVTRPCNAPSTTPMIESILDEAKPYPRVFVANIHPHVHSRDLRSVFEAFGKIRSCVVIGERNPKHKGFAYIEYEDHNFANDAIVSMNNFSLGGQSLRVGKAITTASHIPEDKGLPPASALAMAAVSAKLQGKNRVIVPPIPPTDKKGKEQSILKRAPMDNLIAAVVSSAMVQAGLSDLAADLINTTDIQSIIAPGAYKQKQESRKRITKNREFKKSEKLREQTNNKGEDKLEPETETIKEEAMEIEESPPKIEPKKSPSKSRLKKRSRSRSRSPPRRRRRSHHSRDRRRKRRRSRSRETSTSKTRETYPNTLEDVSIKGTNARLLVMQKLARNFESNVIMMRNLVELEEVDDQLKDELKQECSKYGKVKQVVINQEKQDAERAHSALNNRFFAGKPIKAEFYDREKFENKDYTG
ncbi:hypothetical protein MXB_4447 [Myxobolus squamalis]|nr:hypothetical protein MXB_4447 [Myxobolus squamalis]